MSAICFSVYKTISNNTQMDINAPWKSFNAWPLFKSEDVKNHLYLIVSFFPSVISHGNETKLTVLGQSVKAKISAKIQSHQNVMA